MIRISYVLGARLHLLLAVLLQELTVLQEELDILMTRKEDYDAVSWVIEMGG